MLKKTPHTLVIILVMLLFSAFGSIFGMSEETLAFVIIIVPLAISMGYDSLTGLMMVYVAAHIGLSRQTTVMAYQFGDGITNMITPTSPVLIGALGIARIPYEVWIKWFWKILLLLFLLAFLLLLPTVFLELEGF